MSIKNKVQPKTNVKMSKKATVNKKQILTKKNINQKQMSTKNNQLNQT